VLYNSVPVWIQVHMFCYEFCIFCISNKFKNI